MRNGQGRPCRPVHRAGLDRLDPEVVGEHESEDCNSFIVVGSSDRARDVARNDCDEAGSEETRALRPQLSRQQVRGDGSQVAVTGKGNKSRDSSRGYGL